MKFQLALIYPSINYIRFVFLLFSNLLHWCSTVAIEVLLLRYINLAWHDTMSALIQ